MSFCYALFLLKKTCIITVLIFPQDIFLAVCVLRRNNPRISRRKLYFKKRTLLNRQAQRRFLTAYRIEHFLRK